MGRVTTNIIHTSRTSAIHRSPGDRLVTLLETLRAARAHMRVHMLQHEAHMLQHEVHMLQHEGRKANELE